MKKQFTCDTCGNETIFKQQHCSKCLSELAKYPLAQTSEARARYELGIISQLPEQDQERFSDYQKQLETKLYMLATGHL